MIVCKNCGTQNAENESFCGECGAYLEWEGERVGEPEPVVAAAPPAPEPQAGGPGFVQRVKDAVGIGHDEQPAPPPDAPPAQAGPGQGAPPPAWGSPGPQAGPPPAGAAPQAPAHAAPGGPSPWPAPLNQQQPQGAAPSNSAPANTGSSMVVPIAPAAPADRAQPTAQPPAATPSGAPTQPGAAVRPGVSAVRPGAAPPRPRRRDLPPEERPPAPGETICGYCGAGNAPTRKFCRRCGTDLADAPVAKKAPWYKRIFAKQTAKAAPVAGARPKGPKQKGTRRRKGRGKYYLLIVVAALVAAFFLFKSFWIDTYNKVLDHVETASQISVAQISASSAAPRHDAKLLTDDQPSTFWAPSPAHRAVGQSVLATFKGPVRLVNIGVFNGASDQGNKFVKEANVAKIEVTLVRKGHSPKKLSFSLKPTPGLQKLDVGESDVTGVRITIRAVDRSANSGKLVAIGELEFFAR